MSWSQKHDRYLNHANWHAALSLFPEMEGEELRALAADIRANGLLNPVALSGTTVLDGRNRLLACKMADVEPNFIQWDLASEVTHVSAVAWVISQNMSRRHLTASQRAAIALEVEKLLAAEARKRQSTSSGGKSPQLVERLPQAAKGKARDKAGELLKVSGRYVQDAKRIAKESPDLIPEIRAGRLSIARAKKQLKQKEKSNVHPANSATALRAEARNLVQHLRAVVDSFNLIQSLSESDLQEFLFLNNEGRARRSKSSLEAEELCQKVVAGCTKLFKPDPGPLPKSVKQLIAAVGPQLDSVFADLPTSARRERIAAFCKSINDRFESTRTEVLGGAA
jgi:ParB-like chromosome segregation protein Spo0J